MSENQDDGPDQPFEEIESRMYATVDNSIESEYAMDHYSLDTIFELLSDPGRRYVLTYLLRFEGAVAVSELVDYVITRTDASPADEGFRRKLVAELSHTHLPELESAGFVAYNMERQLVSATELTTLSEPYLRVALAQQQRVTERKEGAGS